MPNEHVLSGLLAKRAEIAGKIEMLEREIRDLIASLDHVDAALRIFDPNVDFESIKPKIPPRHMAFKGEVSRLILNALRKAGKPLPVSQLTLAVLAGRGLSADDKPFVAILSKRVGACLRNLRKKGLVKMNRPLGSYGHWEIAG